MTFGHIGRTNMRHTFKHASSHISRVKNVSSPNLSSNPVMTCSSVMKKRSCSSIKINSSKSFQNSNQQTLKKSYSTNESQAKSTAKVFNSAPKSTNKYMRTSANRNRYLLEDLRLGRRIMSTKIVGEILNDGETFNTCALAVYNWDDDGT